MKRTDQESLEFISTNCLCNIRHGHSVDLPSDLDPSGTDGENPRDDNTVRKKPQDDIKGINANLYRLVSRSWRHDFRRKFTNTRKRY